MNLENLEKIIGYKFKNIKLLENALSHTSYANEHKNTLSNERLEFLGDAVLELTISEYLFISYPKLPEGEMTRIRASVVCEESLFKVAKSNKINEYLLLGKCEETTGGRQRQALLADSVEAIIGAIYLDSNFENAKEFILKNLKIEVEAAIKGLGIKDYKTLLQEQLQKNGEVEIKYEIIAEDGPAHDKTFTAIVNLNGKKLGEGKRQKQKRSRKYGRKTSIGKITKKRTIGEDRGTEFLSWGCSLQDKNSVPLSSPIVHSFFYFNKFLKI